MGNENENQNKNNYYMCLNIIGESMAQFLICISNDPNESYASQRKKKLSLYDYWDYLYNPDLDFFGQLAIAMNRLNEQKFSLNLDCKECLIIRVKNIEAIEIQYVLEKVNSLNREHYVPLILFLCDSFEPEDLQKFIFDENKYTKIDQRMIFFEKFEDDMVNEEKMRKIKHRLERFCSYHNELGDIFTIGSGNTENDYDLTEMNFPFTVNICCLGRFGKGKSTGVNYILGEKNAKENKSGTSATLKINYYQVSSFPVKIYDLPGFENNETVANAVKQFKYLNEEIRQLQDQLHIFLYFIKSTDERMFTEMEYSIFKQIFQHKDSYVIYVLTHSSEKTDRKEIYDMINTGIKGVLDKHKNKKEMITPKHLQKYENLYKKMVASQDNCVFVNFHKKPKMPLYGISDFFNKIVVFMEKTKAYYRFRRNQNDNEEEFQKKIKEEARIRKIRAKALISRHKIGSAIAGILPGGDYLANKFYIKKDAARKAGQIFGFDLKELEESLKREQKKKDRMNTGNIDHNTENNQEGDVDDDGPKLKLIKLVKEDNNKNNENNDEINTDEKNKEEDKKTKKENDEKIKVSGYTTMYAFNAVSYSTGLVPRILFAASSVGLVAVSAVFGIVGSAIGMGVGYYLMKRHCEDLLDQFELLFIQNIDRLSDSLICGVDYLKKMAEFYKSKGC